MYKLNEILEPKYAVNAQRLWQTALWAWITVIFLVNSVPSSHLPSAGNVKSDYMIRQAGHVFLHGVLFFLSWKVSLYKYMKPVWPALVFSIIVSTLDEIYQALIPGRNPNLEDVLYNISGVAISLALILSIISFFKKAGSHVRKCR